MPVNMKGATGGLQVLGIEPNTISITQVCFIERGVISLK